MPVQCCLKTYRCSSTLSKVTAARVGLFILSANVYNVYVGLGPGNETDISELTSMLPQTAAASSSSSAPPIPTKTSGNAAKVLSNSGSVSSPYPSIQAILQPPVEFTLLVGRMSMHQSMYYTLIGCVFTPPRGCGQYCCPLLPLAGGSPAIGYNCWL